MRIETLVNEVTIPAFDLLITRQFQSDTEARVIALKDKVVDMQTRKGHDYSGTEDTLWNLKNSQLVGVSPERAVLVREMDKYSRIYTLSKGVDVKVLDEKIEDTVLDTVVYSILFRALLKENFITNHQVWDASWVMTWEALELYLDISQPNIRKYVESVVDLSHKLNLVNK